MDEIEPSGRQVTFNGPLEAGIRAVALLGAAYPRAFDLQHLTALDYILVKANDLDGGPERACICQRRCVRPTPK
ncbi:MULTISPECIES: ABC-three component system middle component 2 [unclassified Bradyrhizobium]|uniref:ABC-three component system middle component 2 n=1 Tax=unclassified Bradyrhizobium TaxID=2631580 RepID=UPI0003F6AD1D|nr:MULTISPECIES: ABC-three component system middle component 2 [unclassified Bradyrhizobium]